MNIEPNQIEKPEALDMILQYLVDHKGKRKFLKEIQRDLFPKLSHEVILLLAQEISNTPRNLIQMNYYDSKVANEPKTAGLVGSDITEEFLLKQGGFQKYYADQRKKAAEAREEKALTIEAVRDQMKTNKLSRRGIIASIIFSALALIVSIFAFFRS